MTIAAASDESMQNLGKQEQQRTDAGSNVVVADDSFSSVSQSTTGATAGHPHSKVHPHKWFQSQADVGLPMTFDEWRTRYDQLSYAEQIAFYEAVYEKFPAQDVGNIVEALRFFEQMPAGITVLEFGGGFGRVAGQVMKTVQIARWFNYEICAAAAKRGLLHSRYTAIVPDDFVWNLDDLPTCDVLFASHVFEHFRASQIDQLLGRLTGTSHAYVECPIPDDSESVEWTGRWNTHILEIGWKQLELLFARHAFEVTFRGPDVRWFRR